MKCDIRKYFENINHQILLEILQNKIQDDKVINLLKIIIESFNKDVGKSVPLGNITSQIFANIYLDKLDKFVLEELKIKNYVRYNDDFIVLDENEQKLFADIKKIKTFLKDKLLLDLPKEKITFHKLNWGIDFCGCIVLPNAVLIRNRTKRRMFEKLDLSFKKLNAEKISLNDLKKVLDSYFGLLSHINSYNLKMKVKNIFISYRFS